MADSTEELRFRAVGEDVSASRMMEHLAKKTSKAGTEVKGLSHDFKNLDDQLGATEVKLKGLLREFAQTGDRKLFKDIRKDRSTINMLKSVRKELAGGAVEVGVGLGKNVSTGFIDSLGALPAQLKGAGMVAAAALAAAMTPAIGASIGAAVLGGVGLGGIAGGIAAAAQDQRVKAAGEHLGDSLMDSFTGIGKPFIEPLITQMGRLEGIGSAFFSKLGSDIKPLAGNLDHLTDGIAGFARELDFSKAIDAARPLLDVLGDELPDVGHALTEMFDSIAEGSEGSASALKTLFDVTEFGITEFGSFVGTLSKIYQATVLLNSGVANLIGANDGYMHAAIRARGASEELAGGLKNVTTEAEREKEKVKGLNDELEDLIGIQMSVDQATVDAKQGMRGLIENLMEGARSLDDNTEAGATNREGVLSQITAWDRLRESQFKQSGDLRAANNAFEANLVALKATMIQMGYNKSAVDSLVGSYIRYIEAMNQAAIAARYGGVVDKNGKAVVVEGHPLEHRAAGGPVKAGMDYVVGENGPELVRFGASGQVYNAAQTRAMMSGSSGGSGGSYGGGGSMAAVNVYVSARPGTDSDLVNWLIPRMQIEILGQGGDVQDVLGAPSH